MTGVTTMQMDEGLDTGDMILKKEVSVSEDETGRASTTSWPQQGQSCVWRR